MLLRATREDVTGFLASSRRPWSGRSRAVTTLVDVVTHIAAGGRRHEALRHLAGVAACHLATHALCDAPVVWLAAKSWRTYTHQNTLCCPYVAEELLPVVLPKRASGRNSPLAERGCQTTTAAPPRSPGPPANNPSQAWQTKPVLLLLRLTASARLSGDHCSAATAPSVSGP